MCNPLLLSKGLKLENHTASEIELVRLRIDLSYDGTEFSGWAEQPERRTVLGELTRALKILLREESINPITVAGRTDAGVHARRQVCHFDLERSKFEKLFGRTSSGEQNYTTRRINGALGKYEAHDILVHKIEPVSFDFDARFSALARRYEYRLMHRSTRPDPLFRNFTVSVKEKLDLELMQEFSSWLIGLRDFGSFCKPREGATTIRELQNFEWKIDGDGIFVAEIKADAFCHSMVRTLVGAVVAVGSGRITFAQAQALTDLKKRNSSFKVMPAKGLTLQEVYYPEMSDYLKRATETRAKRS